jgi:hypothetical protein
MLALMGNIEPTFYELSGGDIKVTYATSNPAGIPQFSYSRGEQNWSGDRIRVLETEIGRLVSVSIEKALDGATTLLSIVLPHVTLDSLGEGVDVQAVAIITTVHSSIVGPKIVDGPIESYRVVDLRGTAAYALF